MQLSYPSLQGLPCLCRESTGSKYNFESSPIYKTTVDHMMKYFLEAGSSPNRGTVTVESPFPLMHVYHFILLHHVKHQLQNSDNLKGVLWNHEEKDDPVTNECMYGSLNSSKQLVEKWRCCTEKRPE